MYDLGFGQNGLLSLALAAVALLVGLWVWFLVNRASVRANEQIRLLQEIAEQQRQQTALLKRSAHSARADGGDADDDDLSPALDFKGFIPER
ncbi:YebO family protein [Serratia ureilytica]|uniref:YebO family protein n=1 Tax=Serratia ureilytica TaxID=300181 RepID=UPI001F0551A3|nr:YebO family protein [Serratia ureilytica]UMK50814.1 YebO family protein [Serratia ureilytica]